jgi:hypothetical protein
MGRLVRHTLEHSMVLLGIGPLSPSQNPFVTATLVDLYGFGFDDVVRQTLERRLTTGDSDAAVVSEVLAAADDSLQPIQDEVAALIVRHVADARLDVPRWRFPVAAAWAGVPAFSGPRLLTGLWGALCDALSRVPPSGGVMIGAPPAPGAVRLLIDAHQALVAAGADLTVFNPEVIEDRLRAAGVPTVWT